ncbi:unnamed protein product [Prunus armeniaca]
MAGLVKVRYCKEPTRWRNSVGLLRSGPSCAVRWCLAASGVEEGLHSVMELR